MSDPIRQKRELEKQMTQAWDGYSCATAARQSTELDLARAKRELAQLHRLRPMNRATDREVELGEQRVRDAQALYQQHYDRANAALTAATSLENDREELLLRHPAELADEAEQVTQAARAKLEGLQNALREAQEAWQAAEAAWAPICKAHRLEPVPPCPLPDPDSVSYLLPRPRQVEVRT